LDVFGFGRLRPREESLELVDIDIGARSVEPVPVALARDRLPEEAARVSNSLVQAMAASLRVLAGPEGFEDLVALRALPSEGEEGDQLERAGAQAAAAPLGAVNRERAEEGDEGALARLSIRRDRGDLLIGRVWCDLVRGGDDQPRLHAGRVNR
jgi:hypothetical protein